MTRGSGSKNEDKERNIRKWFVDHDLIEGVILLPDNLFYNTTAAGIIVVLNKRKPESKKGKIILLNASKRATKGKPKNHLADNDIVELARLYTAGENAEGEVAVVDVAQVAGADYNLGPSRWVSQSSTAQVRPLRLLLGELTALDEESHRLTNTLSSLLAGVNDGSA